MNYGVILAGGIGARVRNVERPKQFVAINGRPVIAYTVDSVLKPCIFDKIYIAVHRDWMSFVDDLVTSEFKAFKDDIHLVYGGKERMDSIQNVTAAIERDWGVGRDDIIVIHDAARPFVTEEVLRDSVSAAAEFGAVVAAVGASDTMLISEGGSVVDCIPQRSAIFHGQAPDSFQLRLFLDMLGNLSEEQRQRVTGTSQICTMNGRELHIIRGDVLNFKITTDLDLFIAEQLAKRIGRDR